MIPHGGTIHKDKYPAFSANQISWAADGEEFAERNVLAA